MNKLRQTYFSVRCILNELRTRTVSTECKVWSAD